MSALGELAYVYSITSPWPSTATQNDSEAHETPLMVFAESMSSGVVHVLPL